MHRAQETSVVRIKVKKKHTISYSYFFSDYKA